MFRTLLILSASSLLIESVAYAQLDMNADEAREMFESEFLPFAYEKLDELLSSERTPNIRFPDQGAVTITPDGEMTVTWTESKYLVFDQNHVRKVKLDRLDQFGVRVTDNESGSSIFLPCSKEEKCVDSGNGNFRSSLTLFAATNESAREVAKLFGGLIHMSQCVFGLSVRVCENMGVVLEGGGSGATTEPDTTQASRNELNDLDAENRRLREQLAAQQLAETRRQQAVEQQRLCGGRTCVTLQDGTVLFRTANGKDWYYGDGIKVPENEEPK